MFLMGFRRKLTALALCKSIESAIQWFQIHHRITFATIQNSAVYLSGARVSIFSTLVPRLYRPSHKTRKWQLIAPDKDWKQLGIYPPLFGLIGHFKLDISSFVLGIYLKAN